MYPVSDAFLTAVESNTRKYRWHGTIDTVGGQHYDFTEKDIVKGSGYITRQCCGSNEIELGTVYSAEMGITLFSDIDRYTLEDAVVKLYFTLTLADGSEETVPMGVFEVSEANRKINCLELKGYDYMLRFEKTFKITDSSGNAYHYLNAACTACDVELAHTKEYVEALPNGKQVLGIYTDNDIETWRDLLYYTAQVLGCFCQINREGKLELVYYGEEAVATIPTTHRFTSSYSDFVTRYTAVSSTNMMSEIAEYYCLGVDDGLTMNLGVNPMLQFGLKTTREKLLTNILNCVAKVNYVPFDSTTIGNPAFDPGDVVTCTGGHADDTKVSCITSITYNIGGKHAIKCVGKNPRLAHAKSKNDKNIIGLLNQVEAGKTVVYSFVNVAPITIGQTATEILAITFTSKEETSASFLAEVLLTIDAPEYARIVEGTAVSTDADGTETTSTVSFSFTDKEKPELKVTYKMNNAELDTFYPTHTCIDGRYILTLFLPIPQVVANSENTLAVLLELSSGSASIGEAQIRATVSGQGLVAGLGEWNGRCNFTDMIGRITIPDAEFGIFALDDELTVEFPVHDPYVIQQNIGRILIPDAAFGYDLLNSLITVDEIYKTFTMDEDFPGTYDDRVIAIKYSGAFYMMNDVELAGSTDTINYGILQRVDIDTAPYSSIESIEVSLC